MSSESNRPKGCVPSLKSFFGGLIVISILLYVFFIRDGIEHFKEFNRMQDARELGVMLFTYSQDNGGKYPDGKNSTEVFQKLLDGGYLTDPEGAPGNKLSLDILYYPMPGKVKAAPGTKVLKPENVCWDVTCCVDQDSSDALPMIFLTGYKVAYKAGGAATLLPHPPLTWMEWLQGKRYPDTFNVATHKSNSSVHFKVPPNGIVPNFIGPNADLGTKVYRQLTPDGELPP